MLYVGLRPVSDFNGNWFAQRTKEDLFIVQKQLHVPTTARNNVIDHSNNNNSNSYFLESAECAAFANHL